MLVSARARQVGHGWSVLNQAIGNVPPEASTSGTLRRLVAAAASSSIGDGLADVGLALLVLQSTSDPSWVAGVLVAGRLPWLVLGGRLSRIADRHPRPASLMLTADVGRMVVLVATTLLVGFDLAGPGVVYGAAALIGIGEILHTAATNVLLPSMFHDDLLVRANGYTDAAQTSGGAMAGPALGGAVFAASPVAPFALDAVSFGLSAVLLRPLRHFSVPRIVSVPDTSRQPAVRHIRSHPLLRILLAQYVSLGFGQAMVLGLLPVYGATWLGLGPGAYGLFLGGTAVGNVVGSIVAPRLWTGRRMTATLILGCGAVAGMAYVGAAFTRNPWLAVSVLAVEALAVGVMNTISPTLRMEHAAPHLRAQVGMLFRQLIYLTVAVGALTGGIVARRYGIDAAFAAAGALLVATMLLTDLPLRRAVARVGA